MFRAEASRRLQRFVVVVEEESPDCRHGCRRAAAPRAPRTRGGSPSGRSKGVRSGNPSPRSAAARPDRRACASQRYLSPMRIVPRVETDILVDDRTPLVREGEVTCQQPRIVRRADDLGFRKPLDTSRGPNRSECAPSAPRPPGSASRRPCRASTSAGTMKPRHSTDEALVCTRSAQVWSSSRYR